VEASAQGITMFDTAFSDQFPPGAAAYAAYVDGGVGDQPNYDYIVSAFPSAHHLSITIFGNDADCADVEAGAMGVDAIAAWFARQTARGVQRPVIYASVSTMESAVRPVVAALPGARAAVRLWTAHYGLGEHICGPGSCGQLSVDADGTQWTSGAMGRTLDQSLLAADFFGPAPAPAPNWTETLVQNLPVVSKATTDHFAIRRVQALVNADREDRGVSPIAEDGAWGPVTASAVQQAQAWAGITQDGIVGQVTWAILITGSASLSVECSY
jgi:Putative peptidoglycan binding domain